MEAALIFPLLVLLIVGILELSLHILNETQADAKRHRSEAVEALDPKILSTENIMRGGWILDE